VAPINIDMLRQERTRRLGHDTRSHLRSGLYGYLDRDYLAPAGTDPISQDSLRQRILVSKAGLP